MLYALRQREIAMLEVGLERLLYQRNMIAHEIESLAQVLCVETTEENDVTLKLIEVKAKELGRVLQDIFETESELNGLRGLGPHAAAP